LLRLKRRDRASSVSTKAKDSSRRMQCVSTLGRPMFLPTTKDEMQKLGWQQCDVILVTGDAYIDSPYVGAAVIGHVLLDAGYKVGIIAQPHMIADSGLRIAESTKTNAECGMRIADPKRDGNSEIRNPKSEIAGQNNNSISRLGEPRLFWGVTGGCVDSMVSNFTALKKPRRSDDFTPGGQNTKRPNRAVIAYSNLIKQHFKNTKPIVLGGIEASLRRMAHYDYWQDGVRKSILFDAKADYLVYGMGERAVVELAKALEDRVKGVGRKAEGADEKSGIRGPESGIKDESQIQNPSAFAEASADKNSKIQNIKGLCYISKDIPPGYIELPSYEETIRDKAKFIEAFKLFYNNNDPGTAKGLAQKQDMRYLIQNPPADNLQSEELDKVYELPYEYEAHPYYKKMGDIKALETIKFSITSHRGCFGECNFCAITTHQGRVVTSRSEESIIREAERITKLRGFKGYIYDVGGPTANMYGMGCVKIKNGHCSGKMCIFPEVCKNLNNDHERQIKLLMKISSLKGVKKVFIGSGIRHDMVIADKKHGDDYLRQIVEHNVSGQIKLAPEHSEGNVLKHMRKPGMDSLKEFKGRYYIINKEKGSKQFLTYYLIAAHPGCTEQDMGKLKEFIRRELKAHPEQVQIFTPTPGTWSGVMYYTETDPWTGEKVFVEKTHKGKERQKEIIKPQGRGHLPCPNENEL
jgi:uncharacterized radical SAM protein YgiQ